MFPPCSVVFFCTASYFLVPSPSPTVQTRLKDSSVQHHARIIIKFNVQLLIRHMSCLNDLRTTLSIKVSLTIHVLVCTCSFGTPPPSSVIFVYFFNYTVSHSRLWNYATVHTVMNDYEKLCYWHWTEMSAVVKGTVSVDLIDTSVRGLLGQMTRLHD